MNNIKKFYWKMLMKIYVKIIWLKFSIKNWFKKER